MTPVNMTLWRLFPSPAASANGPTLAVTLQPLLSLLVFGIVYQNNLLLTTSKIQLRWLNVDIMLDAVGFLLWSTVGFCGVCALFQRFFVLRKHKIQIFPATATNHTRHTPYFLTNQPLCPLGEVFH